MSKVRMARNPDLSFSVNLLTWHPALFGPSVGPVGRGPFFSLSLISSWAVKELI